MEHKRLAWPLVVIAVLFAGCLDDTDDGPTSDPFPPPPNADLVAHFVSLQGAPEIRFETDHGTIRLLLYTAHAPQTAGRFAELTGAGFYDQTIIHRVVDDFVIQGGDPSNTGLLGSGQTIPHEVHPDLLFGAGAVGLARDVDTDSGDSQWFITEKPAPHLSDPSRSSTGDVFGAFALYAQVFEGMDVVRSIAAVPVVPGADRPVEDVYLRDAQRLDPPTIDLLQWPPTIAVHDGATVQRPLHLIATHPFGLTVFVPPDDEADPPRDLLVEYWNTQNGSAPPERVTLEPLADDPWVFAGTVRLGAGEWDEMVHLGDPFRAASVDVHPWHDAYARFTGVA